MVIVAIIVQVFPDVLEMVVAELFIRITSVRLTAIHVANLAT